MFNTEAQNAGLDQTCTWEGLHRMGRAITGLKGTSNSSRKNNWQLKVVWKSGSVGNVSRVLLALEWRWIGGTTIMNTRQIHVAFLFHTVKKKKQRWCVSKILNCNKVNLFSHPIWINSARDHGWFREELLRDKKRIEKGHPEFW